MVQSERGNFKSNTIFHIFSTYPHRSTIPLRRRPYLSRSSGLFLSIVERGYLLYVELAACHLRSSALFGLSYMFVYLFLPFPIPVAPLLSVLQALVFLQINYHDHSVQTMFRHQSIICTVGREPALRTPVNIPLLEHTQLRIYQRRARSEAANWRLPPCRFLSSLNRPFERDWLYVRSF